MSIRKGFTTTPAVNASRNQDMVHRTVGRSGIILIGEGTPAVRTLVHDEKKKVERFDRYDNWRINIISHEVAPSSLGLACIGDLPGNLSGLEVRT